jgi:hypothetical protein
MNVQFQPDGHGFHYKITNSGHGGYWISYVAIGTGGHQITGELNGRLSTDQFDGYHRVHFPVMHVGARAMDFEMYTDNKVGNNPKVGEVNVSNTLKGTDIIDSTLVVPDKQNLSSSAKAYAPYGDH